MYIVGADSFVQQTDLTIPISHLWTFFFQNPHRYHTNIYLSGDDERGHRHCAFLMVLLPQPDDDVRHLRMSSSSYAGQSCKHHHRRHAPWFLSTLHWECSTDGWWNFLRFLACQIWEYQFVNKFGCSSLPKLWKFARKYENLIRLLLLHFLP